MSFKIEVDSNDLNFDIGKEKFDLACPRCKAVNAVAFGQVKRRESIRCVSCHSSIRLVDKDGSVAKAVSDINGAFDDLRGALDDFGK